MYVHFYVHLEKCLDKMNVTLICGEFYFVLYEQTKTKEAEAKKASMFYHQLNFLCKHRVF